MENKFFILVFFVLFSPGAELAHAEESIGQSDLKNLGVKVDNCVRRADGQSNLEYLPMREAAINIAKACAGITVTSCYRDVNRQKELRAACEAEAVRKEKDPNFYCSGRVAKVSAHTQLVAVDFICHATANPAKTGCDAANRARAELFNGNGGIGGYKKDDGTYTANHLDIGKRRAWNQCLEITDINGPFTAHEKFDKEDEYKKRMENAGDYDYDTFSDDNLLEKIKNEPRKKDSPADFPAANMVGTASSLLPMAAQGMKGTAAGSLQGSASESPTTSEKDNRAVVNSTGSAMPAPQQGASGDWKANGIGNILAPPVKSP